MMTFFICVFWTFYSFSCFGQHIGYGYSTATLTSKNQENIYMGFELGLKLILGEKKAQEVLFVEHDQTGRQLGALAVIDSLKKKNVAGIFGFSGSHDSVLVGKLIKNSGILTIVPGSNHNALKDFGSTVHTTGHSMDTEVANTIEFFKSKFSKEKGIAIINHYALASSSIEQILKKSFPIDLVYMDKDLKLKESDLKRIKTEKFDYLYFTAYPEAMIYVVNQLEKAGIDLPVVAASSWGLGDADLLRRFITNKKTDLFFSSEWNFASLESQHFNDLFKKKIGRIPSPENALGFDLGLIVGKILARIKGPLNKENLMSSFKQNLCFDGLSVGRICFNKNGGHSDVKPRFYKFSPSGSIRVN